MTQFDDVFSIFDVTELDEELLLEMANLSHKRTGLPYDIWIDSEGINRTNTHYGPRIKVKVDGKFIPFEISEDPDIPDSVKKTGLTDFPHKNKIREYVIAYHKVLLAHYYKQIDDLDALSLLKTLKQASEAELKLADMIDIRPNLRIEYKWNDEEYLYEINVVSDLETLKTCYAMDTTYLFKELSELQKAYTPDKIINLDNN